MIYEDFVTYDQAKVLKELGFDWKCNHWYHPLEPEKIIECQTYCNHNSFERPYSAPTLAQAQKWLRETNNVIIEIYCFKCIVKLLVWNFTIVDNNDKELIEPEHENPFNTYEQSLSAGIDKALELLKERKDENMDNT